MGVAHCPVAVVTMVVALGFVAVADVAENRKRDPGFPVFRFQCFANGGINRSAQDE
jgi:hypothetical protein